MNNNELLNKLDNSLSTINSMGKLPKEKLEEFNRHLKNYLSNYLKNNSHRKCKHCGKSIMHKHKNAKFCSNKGIGNCKDAYNNMINPRGYNLDEYWDL